MYLTCFNYALRIFQICVEKMVFYSSAYHFSVMLIEFSLMHQAESSPCLFCENKACVCVFFSIVSVKCLSLLLHLRNVLKYLRRLHVLRAKRLLVTHSCNYRSFFCETIIQCLHWTHRLRVLTRSMCDQ